jgi:hypothetical protein
MYAYRVLRVLVYGRDMAAAVRAAGVGATFLLPGPYFPKLDFDLPERTTYGVFQGKGALEVIGKLKHYREEKEMDFDIVSTLLVPGVRQVGSVLELAERSSMLIYVNEQADRLGPNEGAVLALCTGRALCTSPTAALLAMPYSTDRFYCATRYSPGSYANAALSYETERSRYDAWSKAAPVDHTAVTREILARIT